MPLRVAPLVGGAALGLWARAVAVSSAGISLAARTSWGTIFLVAIGWSMLVAATIVLRERRRSALLLYATGAWWFVAELASPSVGVPIAFTIGLVLSAAGPALVTHLALSHPTGRVAGWPYRAIVVAGYVVLLGAVGLANAVVFDPAATGCLGCPRNLLLAGDPMLADQVALIGVWLGASWLLLALIGVAWRVISAAPSSRSAVGPVAVGASVFLGATAAQYLTSLSVGTLGAGGPAETVWHLQGLSLLGLAVAVCVELWRARRTRRDLTRLVVELRGGTPGGLRAALADRLGDPTLVLAYPIEDGRRYVDAGARPVPMPPPSGRSITRLVRDDVELATIVHRPTILSEPQQVKDLVTSVHLALESERLTAEDLVQLTEIRTSGLRIVAAGDAERQRIERDLHDGAQQRLISLLLGLRLIRSEAALPILDDAEAEVRHTIAELRQLAHGVHPVLLKDAGLSAALGALAETRPLVVADASIERYSDVVESTVYLLVARLSDADRTVVRISQNHSGRAGLLVEVSVDGEAQPEVELVDRVRTLGGELDVSLSEGRTEVRLLLPIEQATG
ncbi:histidine kinase [Microlunatus phosphovorus]|nr:histidine kinase [Microlunatus phosphovorus]